MNRICIAALMTVMICASGCGPSEREIAATEQLLSVWDSASPIKWQEGAKASYIRQLINIGADVNAKDKDGWTPLMYATNPEIIKLLKAAGAKE
jgi:ankyrin repeat protein